ncbi:hypothetical protein [Caulobacter sp. 602-1]|uniref:hypothetical protein n=1 Tax=Caulobacter sp. 602-1 TaxID=2492472 RepID=UPI000F63DED9|nr:hypothetical protein [Caulobacter sp. 602-1]RRN65716.1 hypothetical protein EIK80_00030 [Caulobacter sp. 602-1]
MRPDLFLPFCNERLTWLGEWIDGTKDRSGHATTVGAITFVVLGTAALFIFLHRERLSPLLAWIKARPAMSSVIGVVIGVPLVSFVLMCLSKYLTFASALATTVGVLVALASNNRTHEREEQRFARQGNAARMALPLELSALGSYCRSYGEALNQMPNAKAPMQSPAEGITFPKLPSTLVATFKEVITMTKDEKLANRCGLILSYAQYVDGYIDLLNSKWNVSVERNVNHAKFRLAVLYALISSFFDWARMESEEINDVTWLLVDQAVANLTIGGTNSFAKYFEERRHHQSPLDVLNHKFK